MLVIDDELVKLIRYSGGIPLDATSKQNLVDTINER